MSSDNPPPPKVMRGTIYVAVGVEVEYPRWMSEGTAQDDACDVVQQKVRSRLVGDAFESADGVLIALQHADPTPTWEDE